MLPLPSIWLLIAPGLVMAVFIQWRTRLLKSASPPISHPWLASSFEVSSYHHLEKLYDHSAYIISAHMLLADVIGREHLDDLSSEDRRFAWRAHCDFVIVDRNSLTIQRVIEINGLYHRNPAQQLSDQRKQRLLARVGISLESGI